VDNDGDTVVSILTVECKAGWLVKCKGCGREHIIPTKNQLPQHNWTFDGNVESPTFRPSINETCNDPSMKGYSPQAKRSCCHFTVTKGKIMYHGGTSHELIGKQLDLEPFTELEIRARGLGPDY